MRKLSTLPFSFRLFLVGLVGLTTSITALAIQDADPADQFERAQQLQKDGNFLEASKLYKKVVTNPEAVGKSVADALKQELVCLQRLRAESEIDEVLADAIRVHGESSEVLDSAARTLVNASKFGWVSDQTFYRGHNARTRIHGTYINTIEQDRLQALKWQSKAVQLAGENAARDHYLALAEYLLFGRQGNNAWRLQILTDLDSLPDYTDFEQQSSFGSNFAPVNQDGSPLFIPVPENFELAESDGQRMRWALEQAANLDENGSQAELRWAQFLEGQFSVTTLSGMPIEKNGEEPEEDGRFSIHTLEDDETIARLANGIQRFDLPADQNPIAIYKQVMQSNSEDRAAAARSLAYIYLNRRQYPKAAEIVEQFSGQFPRGMLDSIRGPQLAFDPAPVKLAGEPVELSFLFRNATEIDFSVQELDLESLVTDLKAYYQNLAQGSRNLFGQTGQRSIPNLDAPGNFFRDKQIESYLKGQAARWEQAVEPRPNHWDRRTRTTLPVTKSGLYLVEAESSLNLNDRPVEHRARTLVWIQDSVVVRKRLRDNQELYQLLDAKTGNPISGGEFEFFGWHWSQRRNGSRFVSTQNLAEKANENGEVITQLSSDLQWLTIARNQDGGMAILNFERFYAMNWHRETYLRSKAYGISERPVYRPGETVRTKFWLAYAVYGDAEAPKIVNRAVTVTIVDPQGNKLHETQVTTDEFGGCEMEFELPDGAPLGRYSFQVHSRPQQDLRRVLGRVLKEPGNDQFSASFECSLGIRVEEYRKPEFEVNIMAPRKPVSLGETVEARVQAKYYFGTPVTDAEVHVKVERTKYADQFYPVMPFDWCYGPGYWWYAEDYSWYPGWQRWHGCIAPIRSWYRGPRYEPPELVLDQNLELDASGEAVIKIDTAQAKLLFGDSTDHKYSITVEVRDRSRRTITAQGSVIAATDAFKVYTWVDRGYYETGDEVTAHFQTRMLDGAAVETSGKLQVLRVTYDENAEPNETLVQELDCSTDAEGKGQIQFRVQQAGQYRLKFLMTDSAEHTLEGGYLMVVRGAGLEADALRFGSLELTPDKMHYTPGDTVKLQVAADQAKGMVAVFVRPEGGAYPRPKYVQLQNKTAIVEIPVTENDQPNFFIEAYTVYQGRFYSRIREIVVPPQERVLEVELTADKQEYLPGEEANVSVTVTTPEGQPAKGSVVIAAYDRALEQVAPDTLPPDIREFFWKWRRNHYPQTRHSLQKVSYPVSISGVQGMRTLGQFGATLADDLDAFEGESLAQSGPGGVTSLSMAPTATGFGRGGMGGGGEMMFGGAMPEMAMDGVASRRSLAKGAAVANAPAPGGAGVNNTPPAVRKDFADSALWLAKLDVGSDGKAQAKFNMPENLTGWRLCSWVMGTTKNVGSAKTEAVTKKPLLVRLQTPRFLVERDEVVCSTIVHNDTGQAKSVEVSLEIDGQTQLEFASDTMQKQTVTIPPHQQVRVDWLCRAVAEGTVTLKTFAIAEDASDAMQLDVPIVVYGTMKTDSWAGTVRSGEAESVVRISIPEERREEHSELTIRMSPSLAASMTDALPYLVSYPYGCTEQTLNRFLPTVVTQKVLLEMEIDLQSIADRKNNLNAQELGDPAERRRRWDHWDNPVFDQETVDEMVKSGVQRLTNMQNADGGWGWFPGGGRSSAHLTAQVVRGLLVAKANGVAIVPSVIDRGLNWLEQRQEAELQKLRNWQSEADPRKQKPDNLDALVFHVLVEGDRVNSEMQTFLYTHRSNLSIYGKALVALSTHRIGDVEQTQMLKRNIEQFLVTDEENETAFLADQTSWWYWYGSQIEATAMYLKLLSASDAQSPTAARVVKYLLNNRRHAVYWNSTRDTALVVEAFADYLRAKGELNANMSVQVLLDDKRIGTVEFTPSTLFETNNTIQLNAAAIPTGDHELTIRRSGEGDLYWNVYSTNFTQEEDIEKAGLEVKIERRYYELQLTTGEIDLVGDRANVISKEQAKYRRKRIESFEEIASGQLVEVELLIESKNDYEYLLVEDKKPACLETVDTQSGYFYQNGLRIYRELRDRHVGLAIENLPRGSYSIRYQLRTEAPGRFTALPATIEGMYAPELVGNSRDFDIRVQDD